MSAKDIRNIVLLGHGGSGKTTLAESMLFMTGGTDRFGKVTDGNTTCDYDAEEIKRNISISLAVAPVKYKNVKINVLDTPGNFDFAGEVLSGIRAAECAVLVCGAKDGLSVGAERAWKMLGNKPRMIFINRTDEENSDYNACLDALKAKFGTAVAPIVVPVLDGDKKVTGIVDLLHTFHDQPKTLVMPEIPAGSFTELLKTEKCGQVSVNISKPGITKGEHWHHSKFEYFTVVSGHGLIQLRNENDPNAEILNYEVSGDKIQSVIMLPGYTHNIINLSDTQDLVTVMYCNEIFNPNRPDTYFDPVEAKG